MRHGYYRQSGAGEALGHLVAVLLCGEECRRFNAEMKYPLERGFCVDTSSDLISNSFFSVQCAWLVERCL